MLVLVSEDAIVLITHIEKPRLPDDFRKVFLQGRTHWRIIFGTLDSQFVILVQVKPYPVNVLAVLMKTVVGKLKRYIAQ